LKYAYPRLISAQLNSILEEIAWRGRLCSEAQSNSVTFEEYVKLVVNHYPGRGISLSDIKSAFDEIGHAVDENESTISRDRMISVLTEKGELCLIGYRY